MGHHTRKVEDERRHAAGKEAVERRANAHQLLEDAEQQKWLRIIPKHERDLVEQVLKDHPQLSAEEAYRMLKEAGM